MAEETTVGLRLEEENRRLKRAIEELSILNDLGRAISASLDSQEIMQTIIRRSLRAVSAEQGVITLVDERASQPMKTLVRTMVSSSDHEQFQVNQALLGWMHLNKKPLLLNAPKSDERFRGVRWEESVNTLLCVPLVVKSELKGVLTVFNKRGAQGFTDEDQRLLAIIAVQSGQVIETARLYEEEKAFVKMQEEVRLASKIQSELLPKSTPTIAGYEIAGKSIPAQVVGGDYFDFIPIEDDRRMAICLGDVTGKGLPASLLMANLQATLRGQSFLCTSPKECLTRSNKLLFHSTSSEKFATLFYAYLDIKDHILSYSNAGHDFPFLFSDGETPDRLKSGGLMLGAFEDFAFEEDTIPIKPGDLLVISSDGISEAMNSNLEQFGEERLQKIIREHRKASPNDLIDTIIAAVQAHAGDQPQSDDMTLIVLKRS
jgi:sigma-B regulation protein RsbU (phosphoserine phosphatase)